MKKKREWPFPRNEWGEIAAPPTWMRHFIGWRILLWLCGRYHICWSQIVTWKLGYETDTWGLSRGCFEPYDYCGEHDQMSPEERMEAWRTIDEGPILSVKFP